MKTHPIKELLARRATGAAVGIYSACTANTLVIEAVIEKAVEDNACALIEATANQVNQFGGYTQMLPPDFVALVRGIAAEKGLPAERLILGGDHLGPLTWQDEPETRAMDYAKELIRAYVLAGYTKIHIDTSMMLADDDKSRKLPEDVIARRAAELAEVAEAAFAELAAAAEADGSAESLIAPIYVIGSEVPIPGGAQENDAGITVTTPAQFEQTYESFRETFCARDLQDAFGRIVAVVVQPGVEFSDATVSEYDRAAAAGLCAALKNYPGVVFEGHSTDYQTRAGLRQMVEDGIAILKVGPALTFALREALFALSDIETEVFAARSGAAGALSKPSDFKTVLLRTMRDDPTYWHNYYHHDAQSDITFKLKYSFSDRCRYYLPRQEVAAAQDLLIKNIDAAEVPLSVLGQYMPTQYTRVREKQLPLTAAALIKDHIKERISDYCFATYPATL